MSPRSAIAVALAALASCSASPRATIAGRAIPAPAGFRLERPAEDFACFAPRAERSSFTISFCARPLLKRGVLASNTFAIETYSLLGRPVEVRGLASDRSSNADTVYFIFETDDLFLFGECSGAQRGSDLTDLCLPQKATFNDWLRSIFGGRA